ncbi:MAG: glycoside hydrolase family 15 protein [Candidatus Velthaea sp.]
MKLIPVLRLAVCLAASLWARTAVAQTTGTAPNCCGLPPIHDSAQKSMVGTAVNSPSSSIYFTGYEGNVSEIYYPTVDTLATANMEFLVGDAAKTFVDEEKLQSWTVTQPDPKSMRWQAVTGNAAHNWQITKMVFADPSNSTLIQQTTFQALSGKTVGDFNLYLLYKPYLKNVAANNSGSTVASGGNTYLVASSNDGSEYSALRASLGWTVENSVAMVSSGYYGVNDGWQDLMINNPVPYTMRWAYNSAPNGNVAQMGWLNTAGNSATSLTFTVAVGFGSTQANAIAAASNTLGENIATQQTSYDNAWHSYNSGLSTQNGTADNQYYLSAMTLKTMQDKIYGAMIAGIGTPWGPSEGDNDTTGYHVVWSRDMFKFANALITAGDSASATNAVNWLFNVDMNTSTGRFPQNAYVTGTPNWNATQMDEQAMPIMLAYRLGPSVYNSLWPKIKLTANYIYSNGPWTQQERWEENSGYSPSTIAAEIGGLVDAAQIALANNDTADAANWLNAADYWQQNVTAWTYTTQGCPNLKINCNTTSMYIRINTSGAQGGGQPGGWNPSANPNPNMSIGIGNNGGNHRAIDIIDGGFLELVRMGVKRPNDPTITSSLVSYDGVIEQTIVSSESPAWFRYNFDGYGETNAGGPYNGSSGRGRLWPIFEAERGNYQIAATGTGSAGSTYLAALKAFSTSQGFISEQIWNPSTTLPGDTDDSSGWTVTTPATSTPGTITGSMEPLNWAQGEYITLLADIGAGRVVDIPPAVCSRYYACILTPGSGQVQVNINVNASTQFGQYMYVTGNIGALGNWNTNLGLPVDSSTYPIWKNAVNLPASSSLQYKYYRKNSDGSVTWECYPGNGNCNANRSLTVAPSGTVTLNDTVSWN